MVQGLEKTVKDLWVNDLALSLWLLSDTTSFRPMPDTEIERL